MAENSSFGVPQCSRNAIFFQFNHVDLSPNYAGTLMGITNCFANICGFVTPYVTGAIINDNVGLLEYRTTFKESLSPALMSCHRILKPRGGPCSSCRQVCTWSSTPSSSSSCGPTSSRGTRTGTRKPPTRTDEKKARFLLTSEVVQCVFCAVLFKTYKTTSVVL